MHLSSPSSQTTMKNDLFDGISLRIIFGTIVASAIQLAIISSASTAAAYTVPSSYLSRRTLHARKFISLTSGENFILQKRLFGREIYLHDTPNKERDSSAQHTLGSMSYRPVAPDDIPACYKIEAASYPEDEAASLENLKYRQKFASDYFWCATLPEKKGNIIVGFICSTRCNEFNEESMSIHDPIGSILAIHSVVVDSRYRRQGIASAMMQNYLTQMLPQSNFVVNTGNAGFRRILLLAKSGLLSFYVDNGFAVLRPSPIVHGKETWYELESRQDHLERLIRGVPTTKKSSPIVAKSRVFESSRSTSNPDEGQHGNALLAKGRDERRAKLHVELAKLGIDPTEIEAHPEKFGTAAMRTYNSFLLPKSPGALAVAESPTRPRVVANNISFLVREFRADREEWLRNVDRNRGGGGGTRKGEGEDGKSQSPDDDESIRNDEKHPIVIILDNIRSAYNVGNILRLAEAAQVDSVRLCGMTPRPPHPKVLKTAMGAAEYVSLGEDEEGVSTTLQTVLDLKLKGYKVFGVETTENATSLWDTPMPHDDTGSIAYVFGNELIGVDVQVLHECDGIVCLPTYGIKNSLNVATCVGIIVWDTLRLLQKVTRN